MHAYLLLIWCRLAHQGACLHRWHACWVRGSHWQHFTPSKRFVSRTKVRVYFYIRMQICLLAERVAIDRKRTSADVNHVTDRLIAEQMIIL